MGIRRQPINIPTKYQQVAMDITTISVGSATRDAVADYRDRRDLPNMDEALQDLLESQQSEVATPLGR